MKLLPKPKNAIYYFREMEEVEALFSEHAICIVMIACAEGRPWVVLSFQQYDYEDEELDEVSFVRFEQPIPQACFKKSPVSARKLRSIIRNGTRTEEMFGILLFEQLRELPQLTFGLERNGDGSVTLHAEVRIGPWKDEVVFSVRKEGDGQCLIFYDSEDTKDALVEEVIEPIFADFIFAGAQM